MRGLPLYPHRNRLAFPAGLMPGFDQQHPASNKAYFSCVSQGLRSFRDVLRGTLPATNTTSSGKMHSHIGVSTQLQNFQAVTFTGYSTVNQISATRACIIVFNSITASPALLWGDGAGGAGDYNGGCVHIYKPSSNFISCRLTGITASDSAFTPVANVPYFIIMSYFQGTATDGLKFLILNLRTGERYVELKTTFANATSNPTGTITIGGASTVQDYYLAACMSSNKALSLGEMLQWAADPWSFWYPNPGDNWIAAQAAGGFPYWGVQNNNFVIGSGVQ